ncbi:helix-turn-helix transcriptional regulator [Celeribacter neptunius]|uniref:WYL domain-containing protein n=1 Tax=Celeribacter neptunius TaxID=588602 RepID=A0A1I3JTS2_9RHOB|nr:YafY family protein [Celeribacter neptunius]SFI63603.1 WYL domain-containing protein [Celeribacter neptunius]
MAKSDRLLRLMHLMRSLSPPITAGELARDLAVSQRTLYRDIEALRAAGARIEGEAGFGYTLVEDFALPPQSLTQLEIEALVLGLKEVQQRGDPALARAAQDALAKITASLPERKQAQIRHSIGLVHRNSQKNLHKIDLSEIREACWQERALRIRYRDRAGQVTERVIWPLALVYLDHDLMLLAHCTLRGDYRNFVTASIEEMELLQESFRPRRVPMLRAHIAELRKRYTLSPACEDGRRIMEQEALETQAG